MIVGAHMIIYTKDPEADRAFVRDVLKWPYVDAHDGWLIFKMPPSELAFHPLMNAETHEIYLMSDDVEATRKTLVTAEHAGSKIACSEIKDEGFGLMMHMTLPGGGKLGIYQPKHPSPLFPEA